MEFASNMHGFSFSDVQHKRLVRTRDQFQTTGMKWRRAQPEQENPMTCSRANLSVRMQLQISSKNSSTVHPEIIANSNMLWKLLVHLKIKLNRSGLKTLTNTANRDIFLPYLLIYQLLHVHVLQVFFFFFFSRVTAGKNANLNFPCGLTTCPKME